MINSDTCPRPTTGGGPNSWITPRLSVKAVYYLNDVTEVL
jgi:hypothetical protein